jgi:hypothetical protein
MLYDEYMYFIIEHKVALETGETPIAVMAEKYNNKQPNSSDFIQPGPCNGGLSILEGRLHPQPLLELVNLATVL